jgi:hypothetical protein
MHASSQASPEFVQGSSRPASSMLASAQNSPSPPQAMVEEQRESCVANDAALRKHRLSQLKDMPAAKRRRLGSIDDRLRPRSAPLTRLTSTIVPNLRSRSTPKVTPRERLVMDCVEVVPLREILRRRGAEVERDGKRRQQQKDDPEVAPETPFVSRMTRELLERDEIGEIQDASCQVTINRNRFSARNTRRSAAAYSESFTFT